MRKISTVVIFNVCCKGKCVNLHFMYQVAQHYQTVSSVVMKFAQLSISPYKNLSILQCLTAFESV